MCLEQNRNLLFNISRSKYVRQKSHVQEKSLLQDQVKPLQESEDPRWQARNSVHQKEDVRHQDARCQGRQTRPIQQTTPQQQDRQQTLRWCS